jgi:hypothetical protein
VQKTNPARRALNKTQEIFSMCHKQKMPGTVDDFCQRILEIDKNIRFAGIAGNNGRLISFAYRKDLSLF